MSHKNNKIPDVIIGNQEDQFAMVPLSVLREESSMSYAALGLLVTLMSNYDGKWCTYKSALRRLKKISQYSLDKVLGELAAAGYLKRFRYRLKGAGQVHGGLQCSTWRPGQFDEALIRSRLAEYGAELHSSVDKDHESNGVKSSFPKDPLGRDPLGRDLIPSYINKKEDKKEKKSHREQVAVPSDPVDTLMRSHSSGDPRHQKVVDFFFRQYKKHRGVDLVCHDADFGQLSKLLKKLPDSKASELCRSVKRFLTSPDKFHQGQSHPVRYWATNINAFLPNSVSAGTSTSSKGVRRVVTFQEKVEGLIHSAALPRLTGLMSHIQDITGEDSDLPIELFRFVVEQQRQHLDFKNPDGLGAKLMTGPMGLLEQFIDWIEEQTWIESRSPALFNPQGKVFAKFRREWAGNEAMGRDPLTGQMVGGT